MSSNRPLHSQFASQVVDGNSELVDLGLGLCDDEVDVVLLLLQLLHPFEHVVVDLLELSCKAENTFKSETVIPLFHFLLWNCAQVI